MEIVVDCSALIDALVGESPSADLLTLLATEELCAPSLLDFEVASALRGHCLGGKLSPARLGEAIDDFAALQISRYPMTQLLHHILDLRGNFTAYDAAYIVLADALNAPLVTADQKLLGAARLGIDVRLVSP